MSTSAGSALRGSILGTEVRRVEDPELVTGAAHYVGDIDVPGRSHAIFVRSPMAHALITGIDTTEASSAPGVLLVLTGPDLADTPAPSFAQINPDVTRTALAVDRVRYVGEAVALVVAETAAQAVDAAELVDIDYDPLPVVVDMEEALVEGAPLQFPELGTNIAMSRSDEDAGDPLEGAHRVVRLRMENNRLATAPIEGNAILVDPRPDADPDVDADLTVWVGTQQPHLARDLVARYAGLESDRVRVIAPHVGGAFGGKAGINADHAAVIAAALRLRCPVTWVETRSEAMLSMHGRGQVQYAEVGLDVDGHITGLRVRAVGDCGAYAGFGGSFAAGSTRTMAQGPYRIPRMRYEGLAALTNTAPVGAFRGAGRPEAAALLERLMDAAAAEVGLAPEEFRRRNFIGPDEFPFRTHTGATYDTGDYDLPLREVLRLADIDTLRAEQSRRRDAGGARQLGIGLSVYVEVTGFAGREMGSVEVHPDGSATVISGTSAHGQGHATAFSMIVSDQLAIPLDRIRYRQSDTAVVRSGGGTGGARSLQLGGTAVRNAAEALAVKAREIAARLLEVDAADIELGPDGFAVRGVPGAVIDWAAVATQVHDAGLDQAGDGAQSLIAEADFTMAGSTFPFGAHVCVVEVDTETGHTTLLRHIAVDDCGTVINPMLVRGQQHGGAVQGISQALWEEFVYDDDGTPMTSSFADYALPTAADVVQLETASTVTTSPLNPLGAKGIGESATVGATPAVQNAVIDAVRHLGVRHIDIPCTPVRVFTALTEAREGRHQPWRTPPAAFDRLAVTTSPQEDVEV